MVQQKACEQDKENIRQNTHSCTRWEQMHDGIKGWKCCECILSSHTVCDAACSLSGLLFLLPIKRQRTKPEVPVPSWGNV